jgi:hypothetical protein
MEIPGQISAEIDNGKLLEIDIKQTRFVYCAAQTIPRPNLKASNDE